MVLVPRGQSYDEAEFPGRRKLLTSFGGNIYQESTDVQGFGSMRIFPGPAAGPNISAGVWGDVTFFNELSLPGEMCELDIVTGRFKFLHKGIWRISVFMSIRHNNAGAYREMNMRFYDVVAATGLPAFQVPTGQAATITNFGFTSVYNISESNVGREFVTQIQGGAGSNYTGVSWETLNIGLSLGKPINNKRLKRK